MRSNFSESIEQEIRESARARLLHGRPGDWEHTLRVIEHGRSLLRHEGGDIGFVIPALYLHDIGWSVTDYADFLTTPFQRQEESRAALLHQEEGARLAARILADLHFDESRAARIVRYIRVHDQPEEVFRLGCLDALICFEADRLDRYGSAGKGRLDGIFQGFEREERRRFLLEGAGKWFRTKTAIQTAGELIETL